MASLLPPSAAASERALEDATARLGEVAVPVGDLWDPAACPAAVLPWLAWALSVDEWDPAWSETEQRSVVAASLAVHRRKGTVGGLIGVFAALGLDARVAEWFDTGGAPYTFDVELDVSARGIDTALFDSLTRMVEATKNVRSHFQINVVLAAYGDTPQIAATASTGWELTVYPPSPADIEVSGATPVYAFGAYGVQEVTVWPL